jgi:hypothetical protein
MAMNFKNWKTSLFGVATLAAYIAAYIWPEHKDFINGFVPLLLAGGLISAKDSNVTGGNVRQ